RRPRLGRVSPAFPVRQAVAMLHAVRPGGFWRSIYLQQAGHPGLERPDPLLRPVLPAAPLPTDDSAGSIDQRRQYAEVEIKRTPPAERGGLAMPPERAAGRRRALLAGEVLSVGTNGPYLAPSRNSFIAFSSASVARRFASLSLALRSAWSAS